MKKRITRVLSLVLAVATLMATCAMAANAAETYPTVRVNGAIVEYPDAQPYVDENNRTMIPVRFVTEALGAKVGWEGSTQTVTITKKSTTVTIRIGNSQPDSRRVFVNSYPSMRGIMMSRTIRSTCFLSNTSSASTPSAARMG